MAQTRTDRDGPTLGQLIASASHDFSNLIHAEIDLAKAELGQDVRNLGVGIGMLMVAGMLLLIATVVGSIAAALGIHALGITLGWSFLIVTGAYLLLGLILALVGVRSVRGVKPPERTIRTTRDTVAALKNRKLAHPNGADPQTTSRATTDAAPAPR